MNEPKTILVECPDCGAKEHFGAAETNKALTHAESCPQAQAPLLERTYAVTVLP